MLSLFNMRPSVLVVFAITFACACVNLISAAGFVEVGANALILPSYRTHQAVGFVAPDTALLFGGQSFLGYSLNDLWVYHPSQGVQKGWKYVQTTNPPAERYRHSAVGVDSGLVIYGGTIGSTTCLNNGAIGSITVNDSVTWTPIAAGPVRSAHSAFAGLNDTMYLFGGSDCSDLHNDLWQYSVTDNTWTQLPATNPAPTPRKYAAVATDPDKGFAYVYGGSVSQQGSASPDLWRLDMRTHTWANCPMNSMSPNARWGAGLSLVNDSLFLTSGTDGSMCFGGGDYVWAFNTTCAEKNGRDECAGDCWYQIDVGGSPSSRAFPSVISISPSVSLMFGGFCPESDLYRETWLFSLSFEPHSESFFLFIILIMLLAAAGVIVLALIIMVACRVVRRIRERNNGERWPLRQGGFIPPINTPVGPPALLVHQPGGMSAVGYLVTTPATLAPAVISPPSYQTNDCTPATTAAGRVCVLPPSDVAVSINADMSDEHSQSDEGSRSRSSSNEDSETRALNAV